MTRSPTTPERHGPDHTWIDGARFGIGSVQFCQECGVRRNAESEQTVCLRESKPGRVVSEYDPFA